MGQPDILDVAAKRAADALKRMQSVRIPPTPHNFTIWYAYCSGEPAELVQALDHMLEARQAFSNERNSEIYQQFFSTGEGGAVLANATAQINSELGVVLRRLGKAGDDAAEYGVALKEFSGQLTDSPAGKGYPEVIASMLSATRDMESRNQELESKLTVSSHQIAQLQDELDEVSQEALTDGLTGIANRRRFDSELNRAMTTAEEDGTPLALLMLDIDHFKVFNDTHGHQVGDQVLRLLAATLRSTVKGRDTPARFGGEEFVIILPETELAAAASLGDVIRETVRKKKIVNRTTGEQMGEITVSVGAGLYRSGEAAESFIERVDKAMYRAKGEGRNRVCKEAPVAPVAEAADV